MEADQWIGQGSHFLPRITRMPRIEYRSDQIRYLSVKSVVKFWGSLFWYVFVFSVYFVVKKLSGSEVICIRIIRAIRGKILRIQSQSFSTDYTDATDRIQIRSDPVFICEICG